MITDFNRFFSLNRLFFSQIPLCGPPILRGSYSRQGSPDKSPIKNHAFVNATMIFLIAAAGRLQ